MARAPRASSHDDDGHEDDQPDGYVYVGDDLAPYFLCAHCEGAPVWRTRSMVSAWNVAVTHLWAAHSRRRVWLSVEDPAYRFVVQMALPLVIAHDTTRGNE